MNLFDNLMSMTQEQINVSLFDEVKKLQREVAGLNEALDIANRSADEQMRYKREAEAERDRMRSALEHIIEYWNRDQNESAMSDALWHIIETASDALSNAEISDPEK